MKELLIGIVLATAGAFVINEIKSNDPIDNPTPVKITGTTLFFALAMFAVISAILR